MPCTTICLYGKAFSWTFCHMFYNIFCTFVSQATVSIICLYLVSVFESYWWTVYDLCRLLFLLLYWLIFWNHCLLLYWGKSWLEWRLGQFMTLSQAAPNLHRCLPPSAPGCSLPFWLFWWLFTMWCLNKHLPLARKAQEGPFRHKIDVFCVEILLTLGTSWWPTWLNWHSEPRLQCPLLQCLHTTLLFSTLAPVSQVSRCFFILSLLFSISPHFLQTVLWCPTWVFCMCCFNAAVLIKSFLQCDFSHFCGTTWLSEHMCSSTAILDESSLSHIWQFTSVCPFKFWV